MTNEIKDYKQSTASKESPKGKSGVGESKPKPKAEPLKEFLKREEIITMKKDITRLREVEAKKERERIMGLETEEEVQKKRERREKLRKEEERKRVEEEKRGRLSREEIIKQVSDLESKEDELAKDKSILEKILQKFAEEKRASEEERVRLSERINQLEKNLKDILAQEKEIKEEAELLEKKGGGAKPLEKKEVQKRRWKIEDRRREIEQEGWDLREEKNSVKLQIKEEDLKYSKLLEEENFYLEKLKDIIVSLEKTRGEIEKGEKKLLKVEEELKKSKAESKERQPKEKNK